MEGIKKIKVFITNYHVTRIEITDGVNEGLLTFLVDGNGVVLIRPEVEGAEDKYARELPWMQKVLVWEYPGGSTQDI